MLDLNTSLFVEYCTNCGSHAWCTSHDEARYYNFFLQIKENVEKNYPDVKVYGNTHPSTGKKIVPNLGAFEVVYKTCKLFSKIKEGVWPSFISINTKVEMINNGIWPEEHDFVTYKEISVDEGQITKFKKHMADRNMPVPAKRIKREGAEEDVKNKEKRKERNYVVRKTVRTTSKVTELKRNSREIESPQLNSRSNIESRIVIKKGIAFTAAKTEEKKIDLDFFHPNGERKSAKEVQLFAVRKVQTPQTYASITPSAYSSSAVNKLRTETGQSREKKVVSAVINVRDTQTSSGENLSKNISDPDKVHRRKYHQQPKSLPEIYSPPLVSTNPNTAKISKFSIPAFLRANIVRETIAKDKEFATSPTIFTTSTVRSNRKEEGSSIETKTGQRLRWFPDCQRHNTSPDRLAIDDFQEPTEAILRGSYENKDLHPLTDRNMMNLNQPEQTVEYDKTDAARIVTERSLIKMIRTCFPEEKASTIKISKDRIAKKKITIAGDKHKDSKIEVYSTWPKVLQTESHVLKVPRGVTFKIPLRFNHYDVENNNKCQIFLFKDDQPWQKIKIEPDYV